MEVSNEQIQKLLKKDLNKINQLNLQEYVFKLKNALYFKTLQNDLLLKNESYINIECPVYYPFNREQMYVTDIELPDRDYIAITLTFDQQKHHQLILTPTYEQKKYIEKVISNLLYEQLISAVYGCFEKHKSGFIHSHLLVPHYGDYNNIYNKLIPYFTNREFKKQHAVLIKPVKDLTKWVNYINKESSDFIEWNLKKNTIEI